MRVLKRNEKYQPVILDKITKRIQTLSGGLNVDPVKVAVDVVKNIRDGIPTKELDELAARICMNLSLESYDWNILGSRIIISNHQKNVKTTFTESMDILYNHYDSTNTHTPLVSKEVYELSKEQWVIESIVSERDFLIDYFGFKTLERSYLLKTHEGIIRETPQYMWMRVALGIWKNNKENVKKTYDMLSTKKAIHATPTLFNSGTINPQLFSCFLLGTQDNVEGIFKTVSDCAVISKWSGGIGVHISNIRSKGSYIRGTGGKTSGIVPMLKVYNNTARYIDQCFVPETVIYTKNGPKEIQYIKEGDEVITHDGTFKRVAKVIVNDVDENIRRIGFSNSEIDLKCTSVHQINVYRNSKREFISAEEIVEGNMLCFPIPKYRKDFDYITPKLCRFYGIMIASCHIYENISQNHYEYQIRISSDKNETRSFVKKFLYDNNVEYEEFYSDIINIKFTLSNFIITYNMIYDNKGHKIIHNDFMFLSKENTVELIRGLVEIDSSYLKEFQCHTLNNSLNEKLRFLILRIKMLPSNEFLNYINDDEYMYSYVKYNKTEHYKGKVYDLSIEDNHNYLTSMGLVHNSGKRCGSFAMYLEPYHADIFDFLKAMRPHGNEESLARDLFYGLWIPDLFMECVRKNKDWYLMCPNTSKGLTDCYGDEFNQKYNQYVKEGKYVKKVNARTVWQEILKSQIESGLPYMLYKDEINRRSNQKNIGIIKSSNLCVAPETRILTKNGYLPIKTLEGKTVQVWNGKTWTYTTPQKTGEKQKLIEISFSDGTILNCTPYHKFYIKKSDSEMEKVDAKDLKLGFELINFDLEYIERGNKLLNDPYEHINQINNFGKMYVSFNAPSVEIHVKDTLKFLEGFADKYGELQNNNSFILKIYKTRRKAIFLFDYINDIRLMLQTLGIKSIISRELNDTIISIIINAFELQKLLNLGFSPKNIKLQKLDLCEEDFNEKTTVVGIKDNNRYDDTFCFREKERGMGMFEGILAGNCSEIVEYSDENEYSCCVLASISLAEFVEPIKIISKITIYTIENCNWCKLLKIFLHEQNLQYTEKLLDELQISNFKSQNKINTFPQLFLNDERVGGFTDSLERLRPQVNYMKLRETVHQLVENLNQAIDINKYSLNETKLSNFKNRPLGIGVQGLADLCAKLWVEYIPEDLNKVIFESIYFFALEKSCILAKESGPYERYEGSPLSKGIFHFDYEKEDTVWAWNILREKILKYGVKNSLLIALMPTASTSQILGNNECFEPITSNMYLRRTLAGEFIVLNKHLMKILESLGLWNEEMKYRVMYHRGSIQNIKEIPEYIRKMFKTAWEISNKLLINRSSDRQKFVDQSQSFNLFINNNSINSKTNMSELLSKVHMYGFDKKLKTGSYYIRTKPAVNAQSFTIDPNLEQKFKNELQQQKEESCLNCSS